MSEQPGLYDAAPTPPRLTRAQRAQLFDDRHPEVYREFCRFAREALANGAKVGARAIWERLRWSMDVEQRRGDEDGPRFNNDFPPYYARKWLREHPEHAEFFETRGRYE